MTERSETQDPDERLAALLSLLATRRIEPPSAACPTDEQLAAFIAGRSDGTPSAEMLSHLNRCQACYHHWLEVAAFVDSERVHTAAPARPHWRERLQNWLNGWILIPAAAAAAALLYVAVLPQLTFDAAHSIDRGYAALATLDSGKLKAAAAELPVPWDEGAFGFSDAAPSPAAQAYGAGVWRGRAALAGDASPLPDFLSSPPDKDWPASEEAAYFEFGRWSVWLWTELDAGQPLDARDAYLKTLEGLLSGLKTSPAAGDKRTMAITAAENLRSLLVGITGPEDEGAREQLRRRIELTMQQMFP